MATRGCDERTLASTEPDRDGAQARGRVVCRSAIHDRSARHSAGWAVSWNSAVRRASKALVVLIAAAGAGHAPLPVPPLPPAHQPTDQPAPVPDPNASAPPMEASQGVRVAIQDFRAQTIDQSHGYTPGSRFETSEDRRSIQTPGLKIRLPLQ
jgi:hypothetical protein